MITNRSNVKLIGWSTDAKPSGYPNGSELFVADLGYTYYFDKANGVWKSPDVELTSIAITTPPTKTAYMAGETFVTTGMVVTAYYSDGTSKATSGYTYSPTRALTVEDTSITVSFGGKTATQAITVIELSSIAVTTAPTKTAYTVGETFDPTGMIVTATYSDASTRTVADYAYSPTTALTAEDTTITVTYEGKTATQAITVS